MTQEAARPVCLLQSGKINSHKLTPRTKIQEVKSAKVAKYFYGCLILFLVFTVSIFQYVTFSRWLRGWRQWALPCTPFSRKVILCRMKCRLCQVDSPGGVFLDTETASSHWGTLTWSFRLAREHDWWPLAEVRRRIWPSNSISSTSSAERGGQGGGGRGGI